MARDRVTVTLLNMQKSCFRFLVPLLFLPLSLGCSVLQMVSGKKSTIDAKIAALAPQASEDHKVCTGFMLDLQEFENPKIKKFKNRDQALFALGKLKTATLITPTQKELAKRLLAENANTLRDSGMAYTLMYTHSCNVTAVWNIVRLLAQGKKKYKLKKQEIRETIAASLRYVDELSSYPNNWSRLTFGLLILQTIDTKLAPKKKNRFSKEIALLKAESDRLKTGPLSSPTYTLQSRTAIEMEMAALEEVRACETMRDKLRKLYTKISGSV